MSRKFCLQKILRKFCLKRVFAIDIETCLECGGRLRVIACIEEPWLIRKLLGHVCKREELTGIEARGPPGRGEESLQLM